MKILHRGVENFLDRRLQAVDLIDEQHVARLQVGQDRGEVPCPLDHRPRRRAKANAQFAGDDLGEGGFAEAGRAVQQDVVQRLATGFRGLDEHGEVFAGGFLAGEVGQGLRAQRGLRRVFFPPDRRHGAGSASSGSVGAGVSYPGPAGEFFQRFHG